MGQTANNNNDHEKNHSAQFPKKSYYFSTEIDLCNWRQKRFEYQKKFNLWVSGCLTDFLFLLICYLRNGFFDYFNCAKSLKRNSLLFFSFVAIICDFDGCSFSHCQSIRFAFASKRFGNWKMAFSARRIKSVWKNHRHITHLDFFAVKTVFSIAMFSIRLRDV